MLPHDSPLMTHTFIASLAPHGAASLRAPAFHVLMGFETSLAQQVGSAAVAVAAAVLAAVC